MRRTIAACLITGLIVVAGIPVAGTPVAGIPASNATARKDAGEGRTSSATGPALGAFINIWLETGVDNLEPAVAYNHLHEEYLVVWSNTRAAGATKDIYARRVSADGSTLSDFTIAHNANFHNYAPSVAYGGVQDEFLVVYTYDSVTTGSDIWARRVAWNGSWMSSEFAIGRTTDQQQHPSVVYNSQADEFLVVYQNTWGGGGQDIDAERVRASDGTTMGWVNIAAGTGYRSVPDVAYCPVSNYYLVAYTYQPDSILDPGDIYAKAISWNMGYISSEFHVCDDANDQGNVTVAGGMGEFLAVWEDSPSGSTTELYARRLSDDGTPLGPEGGFWITGNTGRIDAAPSVSFSSGAGYLIVWHRIISASNSDVFGRYSRPGQDAPHGAEIAFDNDVGSQMHPDVACVSNGNCLFAEEDNNSAGGDYEIRGRLAWVHLFSDSFESGNTSAWSATVP